MSTDILTATDAVQLNARAAVAGALAQAFTDPRHRRIRLTAAQAAVLRSAWGLLSESAPEQGDGPWGLGELPLSKAGIEQVIQWLSLPPQLAEEAYVAVFGLTTPRNCPPYETEYLHWTDPTYRSHQMADIAAFYRAFGLDIGQGRHDRHDHVALEIEFVSFLLRKLAVHLDSADPADDTREQVCVEALASFLRDHVLWWSLTFAKGLESEADKASSATGEVALRGAVAALIGTTRTLRAWLAAERQWAGVEPISRIIAPMVEPQHPQDEDDACGECDHHACAPSVFDTSALAESRS